MNPKSRLLMGIAFALAMIVTCGTAFAKQHAAVFTVVPTGTNDTAHLQAAFNAAVLAGAGSTVQLVKGTYYIDKGIVVVNFDGSLVGAGKEKTIVQNIGGIPFPLTEAGKPYAAPAASALFLFYQDQNAVPSSITVSDLTFRGIGLGTPINGTNNFNLLDLFGKFTGVQDDEISYLNTSLIRVGLEGQSDPNAWSGYNVGSAVEIHSEALDYYKPLAGTHLAQGCTFKNALGGWVENSLQDSHVRIDGCTFDDVRGPIGFFDLSNLTVDVVGNRIHNATWNGGVSLWPFWDWGTNHDSLPVPSTVHISCNEISNSLYADAIGLVDFAGYFSGVTSFKNTVIELNNVTLLNADYTGAIFGTGASGITVVGNRITGQGAYGIYFGIYGDVVDDWVIVGNCVKDAVTANKPILLGPTTSDCLVVANANDVDNQGTDNTIINLPARH